jgi:alkanesulfonate monooxygenase SsuD/methylene tetrahydromethanopterin reductase-like flavin-dependent oxidoreductase (luciferase family)
MEFWMGIYGMQRPHTWPRSWVRMYRDVLEHAAAAEALGYDSFWLTEHHFWYDGYCPSLLPVLATVAQRTRRIGLGTGALLLPLHDPLRVAEDAAMVDVLSGGRLILAFGLGYRPEEFDGLGTEKRTRGERLIEGIEVVRGALAEPLFSHHGRHYAYGDVRLWPRPVQRPHPPIWLAAGTALRTAERAGRSGLPLIEPSHTRNVSEVVEAYRRAGREAGVPPDRLEVALIRNVCIAETKADAERSLWEDLMPEYHDQYFDFGMLLDEHGRPLRGITREHPVYREVIGNILVGTPDDVAAQVARFAALGLAAFMPRLVFTHFKSEAGLRAMRLFAEGVMPQFRK